MKVTDEGHSYELDCVPSDDAPLCRAPQAIDFMKRIDGKMVMCGTTNEEVLAMMINRLEYLQQKLPCKENALVLIKLQEALMWLNARTKKRVEQGVETTDTPHK